ncbi:PREDICTED: putative FBD-associated F-box protein At5g50270 [Camelina sativa]|uniref:FBD-associated F-box protein At5g50270 n=1 Tax=Camelina sativa TaxID=90675 RepID=A0ABM1QJ23_CAMSA|nr:PREDICTED: putative FBD-associated F-box protein At5g50270 [Camelina sativa]
MDRISPLPDWVLLRILSFLPSTKDAVSTMVLSKRWLPLWRMVPKLIYDDDSYKDIDYGRFLRFVDWSLLLHKAPILETLHFKLGQTCSVEDIPLWTSVADNRSVREMIIKIRSSSSASPTIIPRSFYTGCRILVTLELNDVILVDASSPISFPSFKKLSLKSVKYPGDDFLKRLLSGCPVLEDLAVVQCADDNVTTFTVRVPSLKRLLLEKSLEVKGDGFVIDTPSLESFDIADDSEAGFCLIESPMPNIVKADITVAFHPGNILSFVTSVKHLALCMASAKGAAPWVRMRMLLVASSTVLYV